MRIINDKVEYRAKLNMIFGGRNVMVVQVPDYNGGHYFALAANDYILKDFEYIADSADGATLYTTNDIIKNIDKSLIAHREPFHEEPEDYEVKVKDLIDMAIERKLFRLY